MKNLSLLFKTLVVLFLVINSNITYGEKLVVGGHCISCTKTSDGHFIITTVQCKPATGTCVSSSNGSIDLSNCPDCTWPDGTVVDPHSGFLPHQAQAKRFHFDFAPDIVDIVDINGNVTGTKVTVVQEIKGVTQLAVRPNPVRNKVLRFWFHSNVAQNVLVKVFDLDTGREMQKQISCTAGANSKTLELTNNFAGAGVFSLITNTRILSETIFVK